MSTGLSPGTRTLMPVTAADFKSGASTNFASERQLIVADAMNCYALPGRRP